MKKNFYILALLTITAPLGAQGGSFDSLSASPVKAAPPPEASAAKVDYAGAPELAYENLIAAPVWKSPGPAAEGADLRAGFRPAGQQGNKRNVCNVFAALGLAEYLVGKKEGVKPDFSEEFLYYNAKMNFIGKPELQPYRTETGLAGYVAVDALRGGVVPEKDWPYLAALPAHTPPAPLTDPDVGLPPEGIAGKTLGYRFSPVAVRRAEIKDFLAKEHKPVVMNLMLYMESIDHASGRIKDPSESQREKCFSSGDGCGGHVVLLTGYDPAAREFSFRNSWGPAWGDAGFGRISEKYLLENCESCNYLPRLGKMKAESRAMVVNSSYGWSAELK